MYMFFFVRDAIETLLSRRKKKSMSSVRQKKNETAPAGGGGGQKNPLNGYSSADLRRERWAMVKRESILGWDTAEKMPEFRELVARGDIEWLDLPETEILKGERLQNYWITSHRWVYANGKLDDHPDWGKRLCCYRDE